VNRQEDLMRLAPKWAALAASSLLALAACGHKQPTTGGGTAETANKSLYDRLGGQPAIVAVVDDFVGNVAADNRINKFFTGAAADPEEMKHFKAMLVDQICEASGGPCKYTGKSMPEAHKGMAISHDDFTALVEDLKKSLDKFKVPDKEQGELLGALAPLEPDIVGK
jgi:hemoglobin